MFFRIWCCAFVADVKNFRNLYERGQTKLGRLLTLLRIVSWAILTESLSSSSGGFRRHQQQVIVLDNVQENPFNFKDRIICFVSMYIDVHWNQKRNKGVCKQNIQPLYPPMPNFFSEGPWDRPRTKRHQLVLELSYIPAGQWKRTAEEMMKTCAERRHCLFKCSRPLSRSALEVKKVEKHLFTALRVQRQQNYRWIFFFRHSAQYLRSSGEVEK